MTGLEWILVFVAGFVTLAYHRASKQVWALSFFILIAFFWYFTRGRHETALAWMLGLYAFLFVFLYAKPFRFFCFSRPILSFYRKVMPSMSKTEREALMAGSVGWEGDLFRGLPNWQKLLSMPKPQLREEEQAFLDGPVQTLCEMLNDWEITEYLADLPEAVWQYLREQGFFGLIIPKRYGGKGFSALAHSEILIKVYSVCSTAASTISVPNSLGPAELLLHYGTKAQREYYLPRLATGEEIPCFALTGPSAGSDAGAIPDKGIVTWGEIDGKKVLGIQLNFDKRYITLAPIATVIGLAFKLYDPNHLLGKKENIGITCALLPRNTKGVEIGRRHFPLNIPFQNGPIHGKDVFIPMDAIIGGPEMAGHGWQMLMECLAQGRAISLPASSCGGSKMASFASGAYARIRRQFNTPIGRFEGVEEALARIIGHTYMIDATRTLAVVSIDQSEKPAIASAITKYHATELGRKVANDAMDVHGGKGICLGPRNYLGRAYQSTPISITVEGANILTRSLIIFGQGAMRCHPYIFAELEAANVSDPQKSLEQFDQALIGHLQYMLSNKMRALVTAITFGKLIGAPKGPLRYYFQNASRFSAAFAFISDVCLLFYGGELKRRESLSGRLGDILSYLYLLSASLKQFIDHGENTEDLQLIHWVGKTCLHHIQESMHEILLNFPSKLLSLLIRLWIFPYGRHHHLPSDKLSCKLATQMTNQNGMMDRVTAGLFIGKNKAGGMALIQVALEKTLAAEPIEKTLRALQKDHQIQGENLEALCKDALSKNRMTPEEMTLVIEADRLRSAVIAVDDFAPADLVRKLPSKKSEAL